MRERNPDYSEPKPIDYTAIISSLLIRDNSLDKDNPLDKLNKISQGNKLTDEDYLRLKDDLNNPSKKESATFELIYRCLPTLNSILQNARGLGGEDQELFNIGFESLIESINIWQSKEDISKQTCALKFITHQNVEEKVKKYIVSNFGLSLRHFILVKQYFLAINEFKKTCDRTPRSQDWNEIIQIINENIVNLSKKEEEEIEELRYLRSRKLGPNAIDIFRVIHNRIYPSSKNFSSLSEDTFTEKIENHILDIKESKELDKELDKYLATLTPRELKILEMHYGPKPVTLKEIAEEFKLSYGRIQQIETKAIQKIRKHFKTLKDVSSSDFSQ